MDSWILMAEAQQCRLLATEFRDRPEGLVSLRLAGAFDELSLKATTAPATPHLVGGVSEYFRGLVSVRNGSKAATRSLVVGTGGKRPLA